MKIKKAELETVCGPSSTLPDNSLAEIAFAGRSNVGKSSLLNGLLNRKKLARTSSNPGKTQTINFYNVNDKMYFVDLPGYGFANVPKSQRVKWGQMINNYLDSSKILKGILLLVDIRHDPTKNDKMMYDWIKQRDIKCIIVATKLDKIKRSQLNKQLAAIRKVLGIRGEDKLIPFSAMTKSGKEEILSEIAILANIEND